jgi:hypothetical protein
MPIRYLSCLVLTVLLTGCGKSGAEVAPVSGRVTLDGRPLEFANISFQQEGKSAGVSRTDKDGHYDLMYKRGVMGGPVGKNRVTIVLDTELSHHAQNIPPRYNSQSDLEREIKPGQNEFNFDLTTDAK